MAVSYKKLWHLLLDRDMMKKDLEEQAEISHYAMNKLSHDEDVSTEVLGKSVKLWGVQLMTLWNLLIRSSDFRTHRFV